MTWRRILANIGKVEIERDKNPVFVNTNIKYFRIGATTKLFIKRGLRIMTEVAE